MGKVRKHIQRDDHALAQWVYRKLVNHDPMSVRETKGQRAQTRQRVEHHEGSSIIRYRAGGKIFQIDVQEVEETDPLVIAA